MVKIRLRRVGARKQPSYRVVVADSRSPRDGRFVEVIGFYNPRTEPETIKIKEDRALYWLKVGAQPTEAVARLLKSRGTMARFERLGKGEALETLVAEAEAEAQAQAPIDPRTRLDTAAPAEPTVEPEPEPVEENAPQATEAEPAAEPPQEDTEEADEKTKTPESAEATNGGDE